MARKSRESFLKRQRERERAEKKTMKRKKRMERRHGIEEGAPEEGENGAALEAGEVAAEGVEQNADEATTETASEPKAPTAIG
jgi:hypothetical protein